MVVRLPPARMEALVARLGHDDTPRVYHDRYPVRELFWRRLRALLALSRSPRERVLDFGGGNGVLLPTLARRYAEVVCVDLRTEMAEEIVRSESLANVDVRAGEVSSLALPAASFDALVAADVLEHITDHEALVAEFNRLLRPGGELLVSAPTENRFYALGRRVFGYTKPHDHYHPASDVESAIEHTLRLDRRRYFPLNVAPLAVFSLTRFIKEGP